MTAFGKNGIIFGMMTALILSVYNISYADERHVVKQGKTYSPESIQNVSYPDGNGGAIENRGTVIFNNSKIYDNSAQNGGGIYSTGNIKEVTDSEFINNRAKSSDEYRVTLDDGWSYNGSTNKVSYTHSGTTTTYDAIIEYINDVNFVIYYEDGEGTQIKIGTGSYNSSGGAIYNAGSMGLVKNSLFQNNRATASGGAIHSESSGTNTLRIEDSEFVNNSAYLKTTANDTYTDSWQYSEDTDYDLNRTIKYTYYKGDGGAIYTQDSASIKNSIFENNKAANGGAIYSDSAEGKNVELDIDKNTFSGNSAYLIAETQANTTETYTKKIEQEVEGEEEPQIDEQITTAETRQYISGFEGRGGAVYSKNKTNIKNSTFENNKAESGGAIYQESGASLNIKNSDFNKNLAYSLASAENRLTVTNPDGKTQTKTWSNSNVPYGSGGAIYTESSTLIENSDFDSNIAAEKGGAIAAEASDSLTVSGSTFKNNVAKAEPNYDEFDSDSKSEEKTNTNTQNTDEDTEEVIDVSTSYDDYSYDYDEDKIKMTTTEVEGKGGAIYSSANNLAITLSTFEKNRATHGGALYITNKTENQDGVPGTYSRISNSEFKNNTATDSGGAINVEFDTPDDNIVSNVQITNSSFNSNMSFGSGGAIVVQGAKDYTNINISDSSFNSNIATDGGAISVKSTDLFITDTSFTGNQAENQGGAIYAKDSNVTVYALKKNVLFKDNEADDGSDIFLDSSKLSLNTEKNNNITINGGIAGTNSTVYINNQGSSAPGEVILNSDILNSGNSNMAVEVVSGTLKLADESFLDDTDLHLHSGATLDMMNGNIGGMYVNNITSENGFINVDVDVENSNQIMDYIAGGSGDNSVYLKEFNMISDMHGTNSIAKTSESLGFGDLKIFTSDIDNGINAVTNKYLYTLTATGEDILLRRMTDTSGKALEIDGFTLAVNKDATIDAQPVSLSDERTFSALSDIEISGKNIDEGWTGNLGGDKLNVAGNGYTLKGGDNRGIAVGNNQTLILNDLNVSGFKTTASRKGALTVNNGGTLVVNALNHDVTMGDVTAASGADANIVYLDTNANAYFNVAEDKEIKINNDIRSNNKSNVVDFSGRGKITVNGIIDPVTLENNNAVTVHNNYLDDVDYRINNGVVTISKDEYLNGMGHKNTLSFNGGNLNIANGAVGAIDLAGLNINSNANIMVDADLANNVMDSISADYVTADANKYLNVSEINLLSDSKTNSVDVNFVDPSVKTTSGDTLASHIASSADAAYTPIYKYDVKYNDTTGNFTFSRDGGDIPGGGGGGNNNYNNINPSIMVAPVAAQMGGYLGMLETYSQAFTSMDMFMMSPMNTRVTSLNNKYALEDSPSNFYYSGDNHTEGVWFRPYTFYDNAHLRHGPSVRSTMYGTFFGGDTGYKYLGNGYSGMIGAHISYMGSHQKYAGNSIYQNGGSIGVTGHLYKGNFFTGLSYNLGLSGANAHTMYGSEDFPVFATGIASKTGYNFEFKNGKYIIQPSMQLSYTYADTFNYKNAAGVRVRSTGLNAVQIAPEVKFLANLKYNWQPYFTIGMNWNIMTHSHYSANEAILPALGTRAYVQYGIGVQKTAGENFTAYFQTLVRNGGRNGFAANGGIKYMFGKNKNKKVDNSRV